MMRLETTAQMRNPGVGEDEGVFRPAEQSFSAFSERTAGKILAVAEERSFSRMAFAAGRARTLCAVLDGDALPLFGFPDGVGGIFAMGSASLMRSARLFAALRRVPCLLVPTDSTFDGVFGEEGEVCCAGERVLFPLAKAEVCIDEEAAKASLPEGYARLLLMQLATLEGFALSLFRKTPFEEQFSDRLEDLGGREILRLNYALAQKRRFHGEGEALALAYPEDGGMKAFTQLLALYGAFFSRGHVRRRLVPHYEKGELPPTPEELLSFSFTLEMHRGELMKRTAQIEKKYPSYLRHYRALCGRNCEMGYGKRQLKALPQTAKEGLCAIIRDFGLLEEL